MIKLSLLVLSLKAVAAKMEKSKLFSEIELLHKCIKRKTMQRVIAFGLLQKWDDLVVEEFLRELQVVPFRCQKMQLSQGVHST